MYDGLYAALPALETLRFTCYSPSVESLKKIALNAPRLTELHMIGGPDTDIRQALTQLLRLKRQPEEPSSPGAGVSEKITSSSSEYIGFPTLETLAYPATSGTVKKRRGANARKVKHDDSETDLVEIAEQRGIRAW